MTPPVPDVAAPPEAATASGLATRVIRKLPPPRDAAESESFAARAVAEITRAFRRDRCGLWLWEGDGGTLHLAAGEPAGLPEALHPSPLAHRGEARGADLLPTEDWNRLGDAGLVELHPITLPGRLIGLLALGTRRAGLSDPADTTEAEVVAGYLAGLLGGDLLTRRIKETDFELRYRLWELESLYDVGLSIAGNLDPEALAEEILLRGLSLVNARRGSLDLLPDGDDRPMFHRSVGGSFLPSHSIHSLAGGDPLLHDPAAGDEGVAHALPLLAVPIRSEARPLGVLAVAEKESRGGTIGPFDANDLRTMTLLAAQAAIALESARLHREALEKERIEREIEVAASIQREILPKELPDPPGFVLAGRTRPTRAVGGDWYDALPLPDGRHVAILADVSGKGIPASLLVSTLATGFHLVADEGFEPVAAVDRIDRLLLRYAAARKFVTLALVVLDPAHERISYLSAGHNPALLLRADGSLESLPSTGIPLGMFGGKSRRLLEVPFAPGDRLCLYSDGITEAANAADEEFGMDRLGVLLSEGRALPESDLCDRVFDRIEEFARGVPQYDDQTLLLVGRR